MSEHYERHPVQFRFGGREYCLTVAEARAALARLQDAIAAVALCDDEPSSSPSDLPIGKGPAPVPVNVFGTRIGHVVPTGPVNPAPQPAATTATGRRRWKAGDKAQMFYGSRVSRSMVPVTVASVWTDGSHIVVSGYFGGNFKELSQITVRAGRVLPLPAPPATKGGAR